MKVIIAGSRCICNETAVVSALNHNPYDITEVVSGHAAGIDQIGEMWARSKGHPVTTFTPDYNDGNQRRAPLLRNTAMAKYADALIAIWDGQSRGTKHMIGEMKKLNKPYTVYIINGEGVPQIIKDKDLI
jgi:hypothetical protein